MDTGEFLFETIKPGRVPFKDGRFMAPHITFWIVARGINIGLHTRMYFPRRVQQTQPIRCSPESSTRTHSNADREGGW